MSSWPHMRMLQNLDPPSFKSSFRHDWSIICNTCMNVVLCIFTKGALLKKSALKGGGEGYICNDTRCVHLSPMALQP